MSLDPAGAEGEAYAAVAVPVPVRRVFTYRVDEALRAALSVGSRVCVPFGRRTLEGTVVEWPAGPPGDGRAARAVLGLCGGAAETLPPALLSLTRFVADYYLCSWGEAIEAARPPGGAPRSRPSAVRRLPAAAGAELPARAAAQRRLLDRLPADSRPVPLQALDPASRRVLLELERRGLVERVLLPGGPVAETTGEVRLSPEAGPEPSPAQSAALSRLAPALSAFEFRPFLLYGATGSGKTEVYLRGAEAALAAGRSVIYLVPEIGLTPLLRERIVRRFPGAVAVLHSGLGPAERRAAWLGARGGARRLVLGTRSALLAPVLGLGLIVVDEEQDGSYKQEETPRYNARDLAVVRAREERAVLLLGSATPSVESFHHARTGRYELLRLGGRIEHRPLAEVRLVDMRLEYRRAGRISPLSAELAEELRRRVGRGEQALVLRNRRGWAAAVLCPQCGQRLGCPHCSVSLTWHRAEERLLCHHCGRRERLPRRCPRCGHEELKQLGEGTEQIEDLLRREVPGARIARMDRDTVRGRSGHERVLSAFARGEIDILVGTQMIAKGHDFPRVTLVGVLSADQALGLPDFRSGERVFGLLMQVAGRSGRGELPGVVLVQAFDPDQPLLRQAAAQDYEAFFEGEIAYRRALRYPPFAALVRLLVVDGDEVRALDWAQRVCGALSAAGEGRVVVSGPGPAPIARLKGRFRQQVLVRSAGRRRLIAVVGRALSALEGQVPRRALWVDVDPYSLL